MLPLERRIWLEKQILKNNKIDIDEISKKLNVSPMTIRRDLKILEQEGKVIRTHGGAVSSRAFATELPYSSKEIHNIEEKKEIALKALSLVEENFIVILDSGTTTFELAKLLKDRNDLTIITNDIKIAVELIESDNKVIVTGGEMQKDVGALFGPTTQEMLKMIHADIFFMGAHAIDIESGVTAPTFEKSIIKQLMINAAKETWLLADHSKFNKLAFSKVCDLNELEGIIVDSNLDATIAEDYKNKITLLSEVK